MNKSPYKVIKSRYITEKSGMLQGLKNSESNPCVKKCNKPKYVFLVDNLANKVEIAKAIEQIYQEKKVKVKSVNTVRIKPKKKRVRGRVGFKSGFKKAIVTLEPGDELDDQV
ncbi:MAG: 50S ribosomal protein L23 [Chlamydiia bacterium]|nr:50S ribosomal protein L23 [Chlamydiia bacterium]